MGSLHIRKQETVLMAELKEELNRIRDRDEDLNFRGTRTEEYLEATVQMKGEAAKALRDEILALEIPRMKEEHAVKIVDVLPRSIDELKVLLAPYPITVSAENLKKIVDKIDATLS